VLNLAWSSTIELLSERIVSPSGIDREYIDNDDNYWRAAQPILGSSLTLVQQGVEFLLKSKIILISPYLLLAGNPSSWPKDSDKKDISFSEFRTIDAQDLIRVHDTVSTSRLSPEFVEWQKEMRRLRNQLMHSVDRSKQIKDKQVFISILLASEYCIGKASWISTRKAYLGKTPDERITDNLHPDAISDETRDAYRLGQLQSEIMTVVEYLNANEVLRFFLFDKTKPHYICLSCLSKRENEFFFEYKDNEELYLHSAQLLNNHSANELYCVICKGVYSVKRQKCKNDYCDGDLVDLQNGLCLSCTYQSPTDIELQAPIRFGI
jgi:hypothetical protein